MRVRSGEPLSLASFRKGRFSPSLGEAVDHALDVCTPLAARNRVMLSLDLDRQAGEIDAGVAYTVVLEGIRNAIESIASTEEPISDPHVRVRARRHGDLAVIEVEDNGPGLPQDGDPDRCFSLRYSTKAEEKGSAISGFGLAIARRVAGKNGATLTLAPNAGGGGGVRAGAGATLTMVMPARTIDADREQTELDRQIGAASAVQSDADDQLDRMIGGGDE
jgi:signal transduction histidine kinase